MARRAKFGGGRDRLVLLLSVVLVAVGVVMAGLAVTDSGGVMVGRAHEPSRAEMIHEWRVLLARDGRSLPDDTSVMGTDAIRDAWGRERMRQSEPSEMPRVTACSGWWSVFKPSCW